MERYDTSILHFVRRGDVVFEKDRNSVERPSTSALETIDRRS